MTEVDLTLRAQVVHGDCLALIKTLPDNCVDSVVTDPPYEYSMMAAKWDSTGIAFSVELWREAWRVLKPGGHMVVFGADRKFHRMMCAVEDAGFELRSSGVWVSATSFPKSLDASKAIDERMGRSADREEVGTYQFPSDHPRPNKDMERWKAALDDADANRTVLGDGIGGQRTITAPASPEAAVWQGWGTALKTLEPWVLARKPMIGTLAENLLAHGVGALHIDACRIPFSNQADRDLSDRANSPGSGHPTGRWPSMMICSDEDIEGPATGIAVYGDGLSSGNGNRVLSRGGIGYGSTAEG